MKAITVIGMIFLIAAIMTANVLAESGISVGTTNYATVEALYDAGDHLLAGTEFGVTKLHKSNGDIDFYCDRSNGLPSERVTALTVDKEGNIWIGYIDETGYDSEAKPGGGGLAKFDGVNCTVFHKHTSDLPYNSIKSLAVDNEGNVWVGTDSGGLAKYDGTTMTVYDKSNSDIPNNVVNDIAVNNNGNIVIGTNYGIGIFDGETWSSYNKFNSSNPSNTVKSVSTDSKGNIWADTSSGVALFDGETWTVYMKEDTGLETDIVKGLDIDTQGNIWICTNDGVAQYDGSSWKVTTGENSILPDREILSFTVDSEDIVWLGTSNCLLQHDGTTWKDRETGVLTGEDTWSRVADMQATRAFLRAVTVNGKIYAIGGEPHSLMEMYDPATDIWTSKSPMPIRQTMGVCDVNGKIYAIGGNPNLSDVKEYDPVTDTWVKKSPMPTGRGNLSCCVVNGIIYAIGGISSGDAFPNVEAYDPATDTWSTKAPMSQPRWNFASGVVNGKIYAIGGILGDSGLKSVEEYDPAIDTWTVKTDMPTARGTLVSSTVNDKIYVIGGASLEWGVEDKDNYPRVTEMYDPAADTWTILSNMPVNTCQGGACALDGKIYIMVGLKSWDRNDRYKSVYVYDTGIEPGPTIVERTPMEFSLSQNYPNPFNPTTTINYRLDQSGMVNLVIYDLLGRNVTTLVDDVKTPGSYDVTWNAQDFASGVYFYRIISGNSKVLTQKMMLVK